MKIETRLTRPAAAVCAALIASASVLAQQLQYPATRKIDHVDTYHGVKVPDPYRWLEDDNSPETAAWVEAQNKVTFPYLEKIPYRAQLQARVKKLNEYEKYLDAVPQGALCLFQEERGPAEPERPVHPEGPERRPRGADRSEHAGRTTGPCSSVSSRRRRTRSTRSTGISRSGSDWQEYKVMELATKKTLADSLEWVKVSGVAWQGDGFYYSRYPAPDKGQEKASINENHQVYFHRVGTPQSDDVVVYSDAANRQRFHIVETTEDERFALLSICDRGKGKDGNSLFVRDLSKGEREFAPVIATIGDESFGVVDNVGDKLLIETNHKAPNSRVILVDPRRPGEANWKTVLPERPEPIQAVSTAGGKLFATYLKDVTTRAEVHSLDGKLEHDRDVARHGSRQRVWRSARRHVRLLRLQLVERAADDLPVRHRHAQEHAVPRAEGPRLQRGRLRDQAGVLSRARTGRASRCSSSIARG